MQTLPNTIILMCDAHYYLLLRYSQKQIILNIHKRPGSPLLGDLVQ